MDHPAATRKAPQALQPTARRAAPLEGGRAKVRVLVKRVGTRLGRHPHPLTTAKQTIARHRGRAPDSNLRLTHVSLEIPRLSILSAFRPSARPSPTKLPPTIAPLLSAPLLSALHRLLPRLLAAARRLPRRPQQ